MTDLSHHILIVAGDRDSLGRVFRALHLERLDTGEAFPIQNGPTAIAVFGSATALERLRSTGHVVRQTPQGSGIFVSRVMPVPVDVEHAQVRRVRLCKNSPAGIAYRERRNEIRRAAGKSGATDEMIADRRERWTELAKTRRRPADLMVWSATTGQMVPFWIESRPAPPNPGRYTTYGLSSDGSTVPAVL